MASNDKPLSKLKREDRVIIESAITSIERHDFGCLKDLIPKLVERHLLNHSKGPPLELTLLNFSLSSGVRDANLARLLIKAGADFTIGDFKKTTPLMKAAAFDLALTQELLALGADPRASNLGGSTALHDAASSHLAEPETLSALVKAGADVNAVENAGRTPLHSAAACCDSKKVRKLLSLGANPSIVAKGTLGTPLDYLLNEGSHSNSAECQECITLLREA